MRKVLITGASGFIGSFLVEEALKRNFEVYAGVRKSSNRKYLSNPDIHFLNIDFSDKEVLKNQLKNAPRFDFIIHAAGIIKTCKKSEFTKINYRYTKKFIKVLHKTGKIPNKFLFISSLAAYGPGNEETLEPIKETDIPHPITSYGKSKLKAEQYIQSLKTLPYIILRPTGVYGPGEKDYYLAYKSINQHFETYVGTKEQYLTFVYVADLSRLVFDTLESEITNKAYFVTDQKQYTTVEFNRLIKQILNKKTITIVFPKAFLKIVVYFSENFFCLFGKTTTLNKDKYHELIAPNWLCESEAITKDFGFQPEYDLQKGVAKAIAWYKKEKLL